LATGYFAALPFNALLNAGSYAGNVGGAVADDVGSGKTRVGRWMSESEYQQMLTTGKIQEGSGGVTFGSTNGSSSFFKQAQTNTVYVEFDVPANSLLKGGVEGWVKIIGPNAPKSQIFMVNKQGGELLPIIENLSEIILKK